MPPKTIGIRSLKNRHKNRFCYEYDDTTEYITPRCPTLAKREYLERQDITLIYIDWKMYKHFDVEVACGWHEHESSTVVEGKGVVIQWNMPIRTDKINANGPDIVIKDKKEN